MISTILNNAMTLFLLKKLRTSHLWSWYSIACSVLSYTRSSRQDVFCEKDVLRNFIKFTGKHLCQSLFFNKVANLRPATYQKRDWHRCFPVNFAKFHRTPFLQNTSGRLLPLYCFFIAITIFSLTTFSCPSVTFFNHDYLLIVTVLELWYC